MTGMDTPATAQKQWSLDDYAAANITFSGAEKLSDSAVAPLVGLARGYETITDHEGAKRITSLVYTPNPRKVSDRLKNLTNGGNDFTVLPWFRVDEVLGAQSGSGAIHPTSIQVRPRTPLPDREGKIRKYESLSTHQPALDLHPAVGKEWLGSANRILLTEGILKGDSVITAQLLAADVSAAELRAEPGMTTASARIRLAGLMSRIPEVDRVGVISLLGVSSWRDNTEWTSLSIRDRQVLVAFDGDVHTKRQVWKQASDLFSFLEEKKKATPKLLDLGSMQAQQFMLTAGVDTAEKLGIDDFLSKVGTWKDVLQLVEEDLPSEPAPSDDDAFGEDGSGYRVGDTRMNESGTSVDIYRQLRNEAGGTYYAWEQGAVGLGGRIVSNTTLRTITDPDVETGEISTDLREPNVVKSGTGEVIIEVAWDDEESGQIRRGHIRGPQDILSMLPSEWYKIADIDPAITLHPEWPPRKNGEGWLSAVKAFKQKDIERYEGWDTMGYVPSVTGHPVYVVGTDVIGRDVDDEKSNFPGVTEDSLARSTYYGVRDSWRTLVRDGDDTAWREQVRKDLRAVLDLFTDGRSWRNPVIGPILLSCALRPTIPTASKIQLVIHGGPGSGKSWWASFIMGFWQKRPGTWTHSSLPGSASDTPAATEYARARTPVWVIDDLAPGASRGDSERQEQAFDSSIRAGFNGAGKRRSSAEGKQQKVSIPRALTVYTAENQRENLSIRQRSIEIAAKKGESVEAERIEAMMSGDDSPMSRLTAAMIRFWLNVDLEESGLPYMRAVNTEGLDLTAWSGKWKLVNAMHRRSREDIQELLTKQYGLSLGESARRAGVFAELLLTLDVLYALGVYAGLDPDEDDVLKRLGGAADDPKSIHGELVAYAAADLREFKEKSNSRNLLTSLKNLMRTGKGHLKNPAEPGMPPFSSTYRDADALNEACGWKYDTVRGAWTATGTTLGFVGVVRGRGMSHPPQWVAAMYGESFGQAQQAFPSLVPPGQKAATSWKQVWEDEDGALVSHHYELPKDRNPTPKVGIRGTRERAVPVRLAALLDITEDELNESAPIAAE